MKTYIIFILSLLFFSSSLKAQDSSGYYPNTKEFQQSLTPDMIIEMLKLGNSMFTSNIRFNRDYETTVKETSAGQYPWALIHRCMDSRVAPELVFDLGIGDIFTTGIAGNVINDDILGSMEYGCQVIGAKLILVLGHTECGAIKGAIDHVEMGNLTGLLYKIDPAVEKVKSLVKTDDLTSKNNDLVNDVTIQNIRNMITGIRALSPILSDLESSGQIKIIGAMYDVHTGAVHFLDN